MVPAQKVPSLQHFRKTEKEVIGGLCRYVYTRFTRHAVCIIIMRHLFGVHALSDGAEATCLISSVIVYTTHSRGAAGINYNQTLTLHRV